MNNVIKYLEKALNKNDTIILACSAGPDSMCLLSLVQKLSFKVNVICAHVNHKVRKQSDEEYLYVKKYCEEHNIIFEGMEITTRINKNFESETRDIRYNFFESLKKKYNAKYILTAHHGDDLVETILMRLSRGSNLSGYAGIKMLDGFYLRPLLLVTKEEIIDYNSKEKIKYYNDDTNNTDEHTRNRYRHIVLPFLKKENAGVHQKYLKYSECLQEYDQFLKDYITKNHLIDDNKISIKKITKEDKIVQKKAIEMIIKNIQIDNYLNISDEVMENILKIINSNKSNSSLNLSNNFIARKDYDEFTICKEGISTKFNQKFETYFENDEWIISLIKESNEKSNNVIRLDHDNIKLPLNIRSRQPSDKIYVKNLGIKKVKDIFIDEKVPINKRKTWPIVVDSNNNIIWLPGLKKSKFDKDKNEKYDIILLSERKETNEKCKKE